MSLEQISTTLKAGNSNIKIQATHNKKFGNALLFINFNTSQKDLLRSLLQKYASEKRLYTGVNMNNGIVSAITGETSILLIVTDNKLTQNISLLYTYLNKSKLTSQQAKLCRSGNYNTLSNDIKNFDVIITGKCKNFINALKNNAPKIDNLKNQIAAVQPKDRENFTTDHVPDESFIGKTVSLGGLSNEAMLYLSVCVEDVPCKISRDKLTFLSENGLQQFAEKMIWKDVFQAKVKTFLGQTGAVGSPSANDTGGRKYKAKCETILACENVLAEIFSKLRGFNYSFSKVEDLKKVNSASIASVKSIKPRIDRS